MLLPVSASHTGKHGAQEAVVLLIASTPFKRIRGTILLPRLTSLARPKIRHKADQAYLGTARSSLLLIDCSSIRLVI